MGELIKKVFSIIKQLLISFFNELLFMLKKQL